MRTLSSWLLLLFAFLALLSASLAASMSPGGSPERHSRLMSRAEPTSFCKCTCFGNSSIVPLDLPVNTPKPGAPDVDARASKKTCNDCNRQFCLSYSFCKGESEDNVFSTCFQRDSAKDQAVVFIFIFATVGLLSYAAVRPWIEQWAERARERRNYIPVSDRGDQ